MQTESTQQPSPQSAPKRGRLGFWMVVAVCLAPVLLSYLFYYGIRPEGRTNHGDLLLDQKPMLEVATEPVVRPAKESGFLDVLKVRPAEDGSQDLKQLGDFRGRWLMVRVGPADCDAACQAQLVTMRQVRLATGRERDRVERLWLVTDSEPVRLPEEFEGTWVLRVQPASIAAWPVEATAPQTAHIWLIDPLGNLMMRFPAENNPAGLKKDLMRLLKASRVG